MNPLIFREYDIRGNADRDLTSDVVCAIGMAVGELITGPGSLTFIGRDCRLTSQRICDAVVKGLNGHTVVRDLGVVPSPVAYFADSYYKPTATIVVTGSHNAASDNGLKILIRGCNLHGEAITTLRDRVSALLADPTNVTGVLNAAPGDVRALHPPITRRYLDYAQTSLRLGDRRPKLVVDAGNGAGGPTAVAFYTQLGFDVIPLYCEMDGRFPNHHPDPTQPENLVDLITAVQDRGAELGIALDGDGDRIGVVDDTGRVLFGDQIMILLGRALLEEMPGARIVGEVKCSQTMFDALSDAGGQVEMWKVGHSLIKSRMKETGALLAGEMSGHIFISHRWLGFDDGIYAGARLLELLSRRPKTLAACAAELPKAYNTPELRVDVADEVKFDIVKTVTDRLREHPTVAAVNEIDGVRASFKEGGWALVRASNTQAALVVRCEAESLQQLSKIKALIGLQVAAARELVTRL